MLRSHEVPTPENVPPVNNPDPRPGDDKPKMPPSEDGREKTPVELPGQPHAPERVGAARPFSPG